MIKNINGGEVNWRESRIPRRGKRSANFRERPSQTQEGGAVAARRKARGRQVRANLSSLRPAGSHRRTLDKAVHHLI